MKQKLLLLIPIIALTIVSTTAIASASDDVSSGARGENAGARPFAPMMEKKGGARENVEEKRAEFKTRFDEFRKDKIGRMIEIMKERFLAAVDRLRGIGDRIEARIKKLEDATGTELSEARTHLDDARTHLNNAEGILKDITASSSDLFASEATTTGERFGALRTLFAEAKTEIKAARESLVLALRATGAIKKEKSSRPEIPTNN